MQLSILLWPYSGHELNNQRNVKTVAQISPKNDCPGSRFPKVKYSVQ